MTFVSAAMRWTIATAEKPTRHWKTWTYIGSGTGQPGRGSHNLSEKGLDFVLDEDIKFFSLSAKLVLQSRLMLETQNLAINLRDFN